MKTIYTFFLMLLLTFWGHSAYADSDTYTLTFTGSGLSETVDYVSVYNPTLDIEITLDPSKGETLELQLVPTSTTEIKQNLFGATVYPNPLHATSTLTFPAINNGAVSIVAYDLTGKKVIGTQMEAEAGQLSFELSLPGGIYQVSAVGNGYAYNTRVISTAPNSNKPHILYNGSKELVPAMQKTKSHEITKAMLYYPQTNIILKGCSGDHCTIVAIRPGESRNVNFEFVECKDADDAHYTVVRIGEQMWMAENLKTTKFRNGDIIETTTNADLDNDETKIFQWAYKRDESNVDIYGRLYTWYAAADVRGILPEGWRLPSQNDWGILENYLYDNGHAFDNSNTSKTIAKSMASTLYWRSYVAVGAPSKDQFSNNSSGFSAVPAGYYSPPSNLFNQINDMTRFWSEEYDAKRAWSTGLDISYRVRQNGVATKNTGYSIRGILIE